MKGEAPMNRADAFTLMAEYVADPGLRKHMLSKKKPNSIKPS